MRIIRKTSRGAATNRLQGGQGAGGNAVGAGVGRKETPPENELDAKTNAKMKQTKPDP